MKIKHILKSGEFADILKNGDKMRGRMFSLHVQKDGCRDILYIGVILPKKHAPKAVRRNYIKRVVYSYFREQFIPRGSGIKIVARLKNDTRRQKKRPLSREIRMDLDSLTQKAGIRA